MRHFIYFFLFTIAFSQEKISLPMNVKDVSYDPQISRPEKIIGHQIGTRHTRTSQVVDYFEALASESDRIVLKSHAVSHEGRKLIHAIVTSPENHEKLDLIRIANLRLSDNPSSVSNNEINNMPVIAYLGYSIHGNEASGTEAAILLLYHLAAGKGYEIDQILKNTVLIVDPMFNPDGRDRFVNWVNGNRGLVATDDVQDREHNEPWPGGRTNHYFFDMNRDWLPLTQPESRGRVSVFHYWRPQYLLDVHEMGGNSTFFFQPGIPSRNNPNTPEEGIKLAYKLAPYFAKRLDSIKSMYYSEQSFDDFYYGKGSTFGDIHGSVGILFEQGSSRSLETTTSSGKLTYAYSVRNQFMATLGNIDGLVALRKDFLNYQKSFYQTANSEAKKNPVKGYLISLKNNRTKAQMLLRNLQSHRIKAYELKRSISIREGKFNKGEAVIIPTKQPQTRFINGIMEKVTMFTDSLFYDVSAWTLPLAYGVESYQLKQGPDSYLGNELPLVELDGGSVMGGKAQSAYLMKWNRYYNARALYKILDAGVLPRLTTEPFSANVNGKNMSFDRGTIVIPVSQRDANSTLTEDDIHNLMNDIALENHVNIYATNSASTPTGPDLGGAFQGLLKKPKVAILSGRGTSSYGVGEVWHLLNHRMHIPASLVDANNLTQRKLSYYNTLILADGNYTMLDSTDIQSIKDWNKEGGTLITTGSASRWAVNKKITTEKIKKNKQINLDIAYSRVRNTTGAQRIGGAIFNIRLDNTHPIGYGYKKAVPVFRRGDTFFELSKSPSANVARYTNNPLLSGYISEERLNDMKGTASIIAKRQGRGHIILFGDNPSFRAFWYGTNGLLLNAVFFGHAF